jgi:hypothetical protein
MSYTQIQHLHNIKNKKVLFLDLETTGIIKTHVDLTPETKYPDYKNNKIYDNARLVSIGSLCMNDFDYDYEINLENINEKIIKPNDFIIPEESILIHGITKDITDSKGISIQKILKYIGNLIIQCEYIIGYNVFFDINILLNEFYRLNMFNIIDKILFLKNNQKILCVGILSSKYAKPNNWKQYKRIKFQIPRQSEVYKKCFNVYPENIHNAKSDVLAMIRIIFWIYENNSIDNTITDNTITITDNTITDNTITDLIQVEDEIIAEFIKVTPYPNYEEMLEKLNNHIELFAEYGQQNHICCKIIYENPKNKQLIVKMGGNIYERGGIQALSANHSIIKYFSPYWNSTNVVIKMQGRIIEDYFQDVTSEWKA